MKNVLEYLENSAERFPEKDAVIDIEGKLSYKELLRLSKGIGSFLAGRLKPRQAVVCYMEKSCSCLAAFFGIVYAGGFYSLLDPSFPKERVNQILSVLRPAVIITCRACEQEAEKIENKEKLVYIEDIPGEINEAALAAVCAQSVDTDPLYCNFTSGSTGVPKGVLVGNRSVIDFIDVFTETFKLSSEDVFGNQAPFDFDVSVKDIYSSLKLGGTLVLIPKSYFIAPVKLVELLEEHRVTTLIWAVSALCMLMRFHAFKHLVPSAVNKIMFSGELMPIKQFNKFREVYPDALFVNLYGPTEITCNCTYYVVDREFSQGDRIPMGIPFKNERVFLLDENDKPVCGEGIGEVCVAGSCLALGYYRNPEMTRKAFCQNPLNPDYPERIYRTGDLAFMQEGRFVFAGRKDFQIKHQGHRIELEEVEAVLSSVEGVSHACCIYDEKRSRIAAFYCGSTDKARIYNDMRKIVPEYMVPNVFFRLEALPLTKNGKTDRKLLAEEFMGGRK